MRPLTPTSAHKTNRWRSWCQQLAEERVGEHGSRLLKQELRKLNSLLLLAADRARVPGGQALTVDRDVFAAEIERSIEESPRIELRREEVLRIPARGTVIIASGPLTSGPLSEDISRITGSDRLYFYDAISPIVDAETIDYTMAFRASRYGKSIDGGDDYINCPMNREEYEIFVNALLEAQSYEASYPGRPMPLFRSLSSHRRVGAPRPRHPALRPHEAGRSDGPRSGLPALRRGSVAPGEPRGRQL